jgi:RNA 2',3'-cyclic 3'-phosphodiesterase
MPRLFTAIEIPEPIRQRLSFIRSPLPGAKWIEAENMHITLRFAGDIDGRTADELVDALAGIRAKPFAVSIAGVGAFGGREPKVLWAGVEAGEELDALYRANERAARAAGLGAEGRAFKAHVTLARMRGTRLPAVARFLAENGMLRIEPFMATRFALLSARPGTGGPPYAVEAEFPFEGVDGGEPFEQARPND